MNKFVSFWYRIYKKNILLYFLDIWKLFGKILQRGREGENSWKRNTDKRYEANKWHGIGFDGGDLSFLQTQEKKKGRERRGLEEKKKRKNLPFTDTNICLAAS